MKRFIVLFFHSYAVFTAAFMLGIGSSTVVNAKTLVELQSKAVAKNAYLSSSLAGLKVAQAKVKQAESAYYPKVSFSANQVRGKRFQELKDITKKNQKQVTRNIQINLDQPIYDPTRSTNIMLAQLGIESSKYDQQIAFEKVTADVVNIFFDILELDARINLLYSQRQAVLVQKKQARRSFEVGTVSITDVRETEAKLDSIVAQIQMARYELEAKQTALKEYTGIQIIPSEFSTSLHILPPIKAKTMKEWLFMMERLNAQLQKTKRKYDTSLLEINKLSDSKLPTLNLDVDTTRNQGIDIKDTNGSKRWDIQVGLKLNWQFFDGNELNHKISEAKAIAEQNQSEVQSFRQKTKLELIQTYYTIMAEYANFNALKTAIFSNKTSLAANQKGYEVGMRVNADVLDAQSKLFEVKKEKLASWYKAWRSYIKLRQITGSLQSSDLKQIDNLLQNSK